MRDARFMLESVSEWASLIQLVGFPLAIVALFLGWRQLRIATLTVQYAARTARAQILLALDERLSDFEDVRAQVNNADPKIDLIRLRRYIAAFERVGYALKLQEITLEIVDQYYGDRFARLIRYSPARDIVKNRREGWEDFYYLWEELRSYKDNKRGLPEPAAN
jgi:hypothetical protein